MSEQENTATVQQAYNNFKTGNIDSLIEQMAADVDWRLPEVTGMPFAGARNGRAAVAEFFSLVAAAQDVLEFEPTQYIAEGVHVVSLGHYRWRVKDTGREFASDFVHIFTIRDGKIAAFREHFDTARAAAAYQKAMTA